MLLESVYFGIYICVNIFTLFSYFYFFLLHMWQRKKKVVLIICRDNKCRSNHAFKGAPWPWYYISIKLEDSQKACFKKNDQNQVSRGWGILSFRQQFESSYKNSWSYISYNTTHADIILWHHQLFFPALESPLSDSQRTFYNCFHRLSRSWWVK